MMAIHVNFFFQLGIKITILTPYLIKTQQIRLCHMCRLKVDKKLD